LQGIILVIIAGHDLSHLWREGVGLRLKEEQNLSFRDPLLRIGRTEFRYHAAAIASARTIGGVHDVE
jgi:hypothetical protein